MSIHDRPMACFEELDQIVVICDEANELHITTILVPNVNLHSALRHSFEHEGMLLATIKLSFYDRGLELGVKLIFSVNYSPL